MKPGARREPGDQAAGGRPGDAPADSPSKKRVAAKRERLQRYPSLEKVDEDLEREHAAESRSHSICSDYFGVRSYLHDFYDAHVYKDPVIYEDDDDARYLLNPAAAARRRRGCCSAIWWKVFVWIGVNLLVFGVIGVLVGYLVPHQPAMVGELPDRVAVMDRHAIDFNFKLYICKLVGIVLFCVGGVTLTLALLFPSVSFHCMDDDRRGYDAADASFRVMSDAAPGPGEEKPPTSPLDDSIPTTGKVSNVQPDRRLDEAVVTRHGVVPYKD